jgi:hypothetical protein
MIGSTNPPGQDLWRWWVEAWAEIFRDQWKLVDAQYRIGLELLDTLIRAPEGPDLGPGPAVTVPPERAGSLEERVAERIRGGFAPPREIHDVQNRGRVDWSRFPDWARPADPELFEECSHEG